MRPTRKKRRQHKQQLRLQRAMLRSFFLGRPIPNQKPFDPIVETGVITYAKDGLLIIQGGDT